MDPEVLGATLVLNPFLLVYSMNITNCQFEICKEMSLRNGCSGFTGAGGGGKTNKLKLIFRTFFSVKSE
jgi:hypothetical protein